LRGAYNAIAQLTPDEMGRRRGHPLQRQPRPGRGLRRTAVGHPRGDRHAQNAPRVKVERVRSFGAEVVFVEPTGEARSRRAAELAEREGLLLVSRQPMTVA
jgi:hypothetical protein